MMLSKRIFTYTVSWRMACHLLGVGIRKHVTWRQSAAEVIEDIHRQGGVAIAAHPTKRYWAAFDNNIVRQLDGAKVVHTNAYASNGKAEEMGFAQKVETERRRRGI